jgi:ABC-type nickel/cobalt efflux system permease component RcnA
VIFGFAGLAAGFLHVLAGPDHLAAVAPYSVEGRRSAWRVGLSWGAGHAGGVVLVAILALLLRGILPVDRLSGWSERLVGVALMGIGLWSVRAALRNRVHTHRHTHGEPGEAGDEEHVHIHVHPDGQEHDRPEAHTHTHAAFAVGTLHGLAGSSHLFGVLPALALPSNGAAAAYLVAFGVGSVAAMTSVAWLLGLIAGRFEAAGSRLYQGLMAACGVAAFVVGGVWLMQ